MEKNINEKRYLSLKKFEKIHSKKFSAVSISFILLASMLTFVFASIPVSACHFDLTITKTGPCETMVGDEITYTITVTNHLWPGKGPWPAEDVKVKDILPVGVSYISYSGEADLLGHDGNIYKFYLGDIESGESKTFQITVEVLSNAPYVITNVAQIYSWDGYDHDSSNNEDSCSTIVIRPSPSIEIEKKVWNDDHWDEIIYSHIGDTVRFNISIYNSGEENLINLNITDYLPPCLEYVEGSATIEPIQWGKNLSWTLFPGECGCKKCGECDGKVTNLTLEYLGDHTASIRVTQKVAHKDVIVFEGEVSPSEQFYFEGVDNKGTLGPEIKIYVDDELNTKIHTSCSQPIGIGMIKGDFKIIDGYSRNGGRLCPMIIEDWESGDWSGGSGWKESSWTHNPDDPKTKVLHKEGGDCCSGDPHKGDYYLEMGYGGTNYEPFTSWVTREFSLSDAGSAQLSLWWKAMDFEGDDKAYVKLSKDGGLTWITILEASDEDDDKPYQELKYDLSSFLGEESVLLGFESILDTRCDRFCIDDIEIIIHPNNDCGECYGLMPGEQKFIEFDARVVSCGVNRNVANVSAAGKHTCTTVYDEDDATVNVICNPGIEIKKTVQNGTNWNESTYAHIDDTVRFNISVHNNGLDDLINLNITDYLPPCMEYVDGSAMIGNTAIEPIKWGKNLSWVLFPSEYGCDDGCDGGCDDGLPPGEWIYIEFDARVIGCGVNTNIVNVSAVGKYSCITINDEDDATVNVICPSIDVDKYVSTDNSTWC